LFLKCSRRIGTLGKGTEKEVAAKEKGTKGFGPLDCVEWIAWGAVTEDVIPVVCKERAVREDVLV